MNDWRKGDAIYRLKMKVQNNNHPIGVALAVATSVDWNSIGVMKDVQEGVKGGFIGPALTLWLRNQGWLYPRLSGYATLDRTLFSNLPWEAKTGMTDEARSMLSHKHCVSERRGEGRFEIHLHKAEEVYVGGWWEHDLYSQKGEEHFQKLGLRFCYPGDAFEISTQCFNLPNGTLWPIHEDLFCGDHRCVFEVQIMEARRMILSSRHLRSNMQVPADQILALRTLMQ